MFPLCSVLFFLLNVQECLRHFIRFLTLLIITDKPKLESWSVIQYTVLNKDSSDQTDFSLQHVMITIDAYTVSIINDTLQESFTPR